MILRTPPPKRPRAPDVDKPIVESPPGSGVGSGRRLVIYEDPPVAAAAPEASHEPSDQYLCTYQCRQMVRPLLDFIVAKLLIQVDSHLVLSKVILSTKAFVVLAQVESVFFRRGTFKCFSDVLIHIFCTAYKLHNFASFV